jgi:hypothetical protein
MEKCVAEQDELLYGTCISNNYIKLKEDYTRIP